MLDPDSVDLTGLCAALDDHTPGVSWWIDPMTGAITSHLAGVGGPRPTGKRIRPTESHESYQDMAQFVAAVHHRRAADLLDRAITGRGAFRRFKDTLVEFPDLRDQWFRYRDARARRRALRWLADEELVAREVAERLAAGYPDPTAGAADLPAAVAADLAMLYGGRLQQVLVFGSWVHGEGPGEFDLQLLVVLSELRSAWEELDRMDEVLWRHTERSGLTVTAMPVDASGLRSAITPLLARAAAEMRVVA